MTIDETYASARKAYFDWASFLINPRFIKADYRLTWRGGRTVFLTEPINARSMSELVEAGAFSFQIREDEAIVQWQYDFASRGRSLERAQLAYYALCRTEDVDGATTPCPLPETTADATADDGLSVEDQLAAIEEPGDAEASERIYPGSDAHASWFRIDFVAADASDVLHHRCHLHIGGVPRSRVALNRVPNPGQFLEWIFALRYPASYLRHRLDDQRNYKNVELVRSIAHPRLPVGLLTAGLGIPHVAFPGGDSFESRDSGSGS